MIGLAILIVLAIWAAIAFVLMFVFTMKMKNKLQRWLLICLLSPLVFVAPVADVIIGEYQFDQVCKEKKWIYNESKVRNREVRYGGQSVERIDDKFIPIEKITTNWVDPVTDSVLVSQIKFRVGGGWLMRAILNKPKYPTTSSVCYPDEYRNVFFERLNIIKVEDKK